MRYLDYFSSKYKTRINGDKCHLEFPVLNKKISTNKLEETGISDIVYLNALTAVI